MTNQFALQNNNTQLTGSHKPLDKSAISHIL
jgi:hypothetical protein